MHLHDHIFLAIESIDCARRENRPWLAKAWRDSALMHACVAVDGTARRFFEVDEVGRKRYKDFLRHYWWIIERFIGDGLNLEETRWDHLTILVDDGKPIPSPDLVDVIYHIFRCNHAHARQVPLEYELLPSGDGYYPWSISSGALQMPDSVIWALLAVSVFCRANGDIQTDSPHYLSWGAQQLNIPTFQFKISSWWGKEERLREVLAPYPQMRVKMENLSQMKEKVS